MNKLQQVLQQQCDYGEHEFTIASDGKNCIKCKLHVAEQTELEEIKDVIAEHILTKGNQVYISGEGEEKLKKEFEIVKKLGESMGYGNMMSICSALWRKTLKDKYGHTVGAFVPTCKEFILKKHHKMTEDGEKVYDSWCDKFYK